ncbi:MAG: toll/interleukin-1 receptor domain-containing protein, partial [Anaerolineae bacterium]
MADVFLSYSRKDKTFVERVHASLAADGRDVWVDWEDIPLTADWWGEICSGIEAANTFIFVISPDSVSSPVCNMEIDHATRHNKRLVPIVRIPADEKAMLANLTQRELDDGIRKMLAGRELAVVAKENWLALARHNWLFFKDDVEFTTNYAQLLKAIDTDLEYVRDHTRLTLRAREWEIKTRNNSFLLRGDDLLNAEAWLTHAVGKEPAPTPLHAEYIAESRQAENARQQEALE